MRIQRRRQMWEWMTCGSVLAVMAVGMLYLTSRVSAGQDSNATVYYQVTYKNGEIKDLPSPPKTGEGILMVVKFVRYDKELPSAETVSTGNQPIEMLNPPRTSSTQFTWNGQAWVPAIEPRQPRSARPAGRTARAASVSADPYAQAEQYLTAARKAVKQARIDLSAGQTDQARQQLDRAAEQHQQLAVALARLRVAPRPAVADRPARDPHTPNPPPPVLRGATDYNGPVEPAGWGGLGGWPYFGNVSTYTERPNPDYDTGPRVIIREQD